MANPVAKFSTPISMSGPGKLAELPDITRLSPTVTRILGQNPSLMTLQGTNSYLVQPANAPSALLIIVDTSSPGAPAEAYVGKVLEHLRSLASEAGSDSLPVVEHIVLTHRHGDHVGGLTALLLGLKSAGNPPPRVWKLPSPDEAALAASPRDAYSADITLAKTLSALEDAYVPASDGPVHALAEGQVITVTAPGGGAAGVEVVHTPGHTADSISLIVHGDDGAVMTADTVLGQGTTIFTDFAAYLASLRKLLDLRPRVVYPAHGPHIVSEEACAAHIEGYIKHRQDRENKLIDALRSLSSAPSLGERLDAIRAKEVADAACHIGGDDADLAGAKAAAAKSIVDAFPQPGEPGSNATTVPLLCRLVYGTGHEPLIWAASRTVQAHMVKLEGEGRARRLTARMPKIVNWAVEGVEETEAWEWIGEAKGEPVKIRNTASTAGTKSDLYGA